MKAGTIAVELEIVHMLWGTVGSLIWLEKGIREIKFQSAVVSVQVGKDIFWF